MASKSIRICAALEGGISPTSSRTGSTRSSDHMRREGKQSPPSIFLERFIEIVDGNPKRGLERLLPCRRRSQQPEVLDV